MTTARVVIIIILHMCEFVGNSTHNAQVLCFKPGAEFLLHGPHVGRLNFFDK